MSMGAWLAFFNLYLETKGLSGSQIGLVGGIYQAALFLFAPLLGILADRYGIKKLLTISLIISSTLLFFFQFIDQYFLLIIYTLIMSFFLQPIGSLIDSLAIKFVRNEKYSSFGQLRFWGSIGWAISTYVVGLLLTRYNINFIFILSSAILILLLIILINYECSEKIEKSGFIKLHQYKLLFENKTLIFFYIIILIYGITVAPLNIFINLYLKEIGSDLNIIGIAFSVQALSEIPFFIYGNRFVKKYGAEISIIISILVTIIRMIFYGIISSPIHAIFVGLAQGFTFSLFLVAVVEYVHDKIPNNLRATGQSFIWAAHFGAGITLGNILTGKIYDTIGIKSVFIYDAILVGIILLGLIYFFKKIKILTK
jgi:MFS transporter, PPP family, 3-phenylpropionic acid transporter